MATLPVDFLDDILNASMNGKRKYRITHADGSTEEVILEDVSEYDQVGSNFGAAQVNQTNEAVNEKLESADVVDPMVATEEGFAADAKLTGDALSELNKNWENILSASFIVPDATSQSLKKDISNYRFLLISIAINGSADIRANYLAMPLTGLRNFMSVHDGTNSCFISFKLTNNTIEIADSKFTGSWSKASFVGVYGIK